MRITQATFRPITIEIETPEELADLLNVFEGNPPRGGSAARLHEMLKAARRGDTNALAGTDSLPPVRTR